MNAAVARPPGVSLGDRSPTGAEEHGHVGAGGVDDAADGVGGPGNGVHHHHLGTPGNHRVAMGHADGGNLVRHRDGTRRRQFLHLALGVGLYDRREIRAAVAEEILYPAGSQQLQVGLSDTLHRGVVVHFNFLAKRGAAT